MRPSYGLAWTPDGKYLIVSDRPAPSGSTGLFLLSVDTGEKRRLTLGVDVDPQYDGSNLINGSRFGIISRWREGSAAQEGLETGVRSIQQ